MTSFVSGLLLGLLIGTLFGLLGAGLARASADASASEEKWWDELTAADKGKPMSSWRWTW